MRKLLLCLVALVLVAPACSVFGTPPAATVDGYEITADALEAEFDAIRGNDAFAASIGQVYGFPAGNESQVDDAFDSALVANILSLRVWFRLLVEHVDEAEGLQEALDEATAQVEESLPGEFDSNFGEGTFEAFPEHFQDEIVLQFALPQALQAWSADQIGEDPEAYFDAHPEAFEEICVEHVLVGAQGGRTPAETQQAASALLDRIEDGEDFTAIATDESDDPAAAAEGGALGCGSRALLQFDPTFEAAAFALDEGEISEPVATQFGSHLIRVTERTTPSSFDDVADSAAQVMSNAVAEVQNEFLFGTICGADVDVNPRYGSWETASCDALVPQELPRVEPPDGPQTDDVQEVPSGF
jgi:parvulin-like peptidyl-prolyl isomerase